MAEVQLPPRQLRPHRRISYNRSIISSSRPRSRIVAPSTLSSTSSSTSRKPTPPTTKRRRTTPPTTTTTKPNLRLGPDPTASISPDTENLVELAQLIAVHTAKISAYLAALDLPAPSFREEGPVAWALPDGAPGAADIEASRLIVIDATQRLRNLVLGPRDYLTSFMPNEMLSMHAVSRYNLAAAVPLGGSATFESLAAASGLAEDATRRLIRHAMSKNIFCHATTTITTSDVAGKPTTTTVVDGDRVAHTAVSRLLAEDPALNDWLRVSTDESYRAAAHTLDALERWPGSEEPHETGFALAETHPRGIYDAFRAEPARGARFANAMKTLLRTPAWNPAHLVAGYDWAGLGEKAVVVDVGGSSGEIARCLTAAVPSLSVIVQDLPEVLKEEGGAAAEAVERATAGAEAGAAAGAGADRVTFMPHDFFSPQPVAGADAYLLRWILHNWPDAHCIKILRALIPALRPGARILVNEHVLPPPSSATPATGAGFSSQWRAQRVRGADLTMLQLYNSREREQAEWVRLFEQADSRFRFVGMRQPAGSAMAVLEAVWEG